MKPKTNSLKKKKKNVWSLVRLTKKKTQNTTIRKKGRHHYRPCIKEMLIVES